MSCPTECKFSVHIDVRNTLKCAQLISDVFYAHDYLLYAASAKSLFFCLSVFQMYVPSFCLSVCQGGVSPPCSFVCLSVKVCPLLIILSVCLSRVDLFLITLTICPSKVGPVLVFFSICLSGVSYRYLPCFFPYAKDRSPPCPFVYLSAKSMSLRYLFCRPSVSEG